MIQPPFAQFKKKQSLQYQSFSEFIIQLGESGILREKSAEVGPTEIHSEYFKKELEYLTSCFLKYRGITGHGRGISAVQVGIARRLCLIFTPEKILVIINPKITARSAEGLKYPEMCMSIFPIIAPVIRPAWIEFEYLDEAGSRQFWNTKDDTPDGRILNRVFQHEFDHLDGRLNIDYCHGEDLILESDPKFYELAKFEEIKTTR